MLSIPHACDSPAEMNVHLLLLVTSVGKLIGEAMLPSPSWPTLPSPQHQPVAAAVTSTAHVKSEPALMVFTCPIVLESTRVGTPLSASVLLSPSSPLASEPQHHAALLVSMPQVWSPPAVIFFHVCAPSTNVGLDLLATVLSPSCL